MFAPIPDGVWAGKSTSIKPTENVPENQIIYEKDTGYFFIFDKETKSWFKIGKEG